MFIEIFASVEKKIKDTCVICFKIEMQETGMIFFWFKRMSPSSIFGLCSNSFTNALAKYLFQWTRQILVRWKITSISYAVVAPVSDFSENCLQLDKGWQTPNHYHLAKKTVYLCHNWWQLCKRKTMHHQLVYCQLCTKKCGPSAVVHGAFEVTDTLL